MTINDDTDDEPSRLVRNGLGRGEHYLPLRVGLGQGKHYLPLREGLGREHDLPLRDGLGREHDLPLRDGLDRDHDRSLSTADAHLGFNRYWSFENCPTAVFDQSGLRELNDDYRQLASSIDVRNEITQLERMYTSSVHAMSRATSNPSMSNSYSPERRTNSYPQQFKQKQFEPVPQSNNSGVERLRDVQSLRGLASMLNCDIQYNLSTSGATSTESNDIPILGSALQRDIPFRQQSQSFYGMNEVTYSVEQTGRSTLKEQNGPSYGGCVGNVENFRLSTNPVNVPQHKDWKQPQLEQQVRLSCEEQVSSDVVMERVNISSDEEEVTAPQKAPRWIGGPPALPRQEPLNLTKKRVASAMNLPMYNDLTVNNSELRQRISSGQSYFNRFRKAGTFHSPARTRFVHPPPTLHPQPTLSSPSSAQPLTNAPIAPLPSIVCIKFLK